MRILSLLFFGLIVLNFIKYKENVIKSVIPWTIYAMLAAVFVVLIVLFHRWGSSLYEAVCYSILIVFSIMMWKKSEGISKKGVQVAFNLTMTIRIIEWNQIEKITVQYVSDHILRVEIFSYPLNRSFYVREKYLPTIKKMCSGNGVKFKIQESE